MPDTRDESTGEQLGKRGQLHRRERCVPRPRGQDADAHDHPLGHREEGAGLRDAATEAEVLDDPDLV